MKEVRKKIGEMLLDGNAIKAYQLELALEHQRRWGGKLASILIEMGSANEKTVASYLGKQHGWQWIDLENIHIPTQVLQMVHYEVAQKYKILPLSFKDGRLTIATSDPVDYRIIDELSFVLGLNDIRTVFAMESSIELALKKFYPSESVRATAYVKTGKSAKVAAYS